MKIVRTVLTTILMMPLLYSCTGGIFKPSDPIEAQMVDMGIVTTDMSNPYLVSTKLIAKELERSREFSGFINKEGMPPAVQLKKNLGSPPALYLYYPSQSYFFTYQFINGYGFIKGPFLIQDKDFTKLKMLLETKLKKNFTKEVVASTKDNSTKPKEQYIKKKSQSAKVKKYEDRFEKKESKRTDSKIKLPPSILNSPIATTNKPHSILEIIEAIAQKQTVEAETTPRGDLVHHVTSLHESFGLISLWYTGNAHNAPKIARINGITLKEKLITGDIIVIPSYLVNNKKQLNSKLLRQFVKALTENNYPIP